MSRNFTPDDLPPWLRDDSERRKAKKPSEPPPDSPQGTVDSETIPPWLRETPPPPPPPELPEAAPPMPKVNPFGIDEEWLKTGDALPSEIQTDLTYDEWAAQQREAKRIKDIEEEIPDLLSDVTPASLPQTMNTGMLPDWFLGLEEIDTSDAPDWFKRGAPPPSATASASSEPAPWLPPVPDEPPPAAPTPAVTDDLPDDTEWLKNLAPPTQAAPNRTPLGEVDWLNLTDDADEELPLLYDEDDLFSSTADGGDDDLLAAQSFDPASLFGSAPPRQETRPPRSEPPQPPREKSIKTNILDDDAPPPVREESIKTRYLDDAPLPPAAGMAPDDLRGLVTQHFSEIHPPADFTDQLLESAPEPAAPPEPKLVESPQSAAEWLEELQDMMAFANPTADATAEPILPAAEADFEWNAPTIAADADAVESAAPNLSFDWDEVEAVPDVEPEDDSSWLLGLDEPEEPRAPRKQTTGLLNWGKPQPEPEPTEQELQPEADDEGLIDDGTSFADELAEMWAQEEAEDALTLDAAMDDAMDWEAVVRSRVDEVRSVISPEDDLPDRPSLIAQFDTFDDELEEESAAPAVEHPSDNLDMSWLSDEIFDEGASGGETDVSAAMPDAAAALGEVNFDALFSDDLPSFDESLESVKPNLPATGDLTFDTLFGEVVTPEVEAVDEAAPLEAEMSLEQAFEAGDAALDNQAPEDLTFDDLFGDAAEIDTSLAAAEAFAADDLTFDDDFSAADADEPFALPTTGELTFPTTEPSFDAAFDDALSFDDVFAQQPTLESTPPDEALAYDFDELFAEDGTADNVLPLDDEPAALPADFSFDEIEDEPAVEADDAFLSRLGESDAEAPPEDEFFAAFEKRPNVVPEQGSPDWLTKLEKVDLNAAIEQEEASSTPFSEPFDTDGETAASDAAAIDDYLAGLAAATPVVQPSASALLTDMDIDVDELFDAPVEEVPARPVPTARSTPAEGEISALPASVDWLRDLQASVGELSATAVLRQRKDRSLDELPERVRALRTLQERLPTTVMPVPDDDPLAALLPGIFAQLPPAPPATGDLALLQPLSLTPEQHKRAELLRLMAGTLPAALQTSAPTPLDETIADDDFFADLEDGETFVRDTLPAAAVPAPRQRRRRRRALRIPLERWLVALIMIGAVSAPFYLPILRVGTLPPAQFADSGAARAVYERIDALPPGSLVLVGVEYGSAGAAELDALAEALLRHLLLRGAYPVVGGGNAIGLLRAESMLKRISADPEFLERLGAAQALQAERDYFIVRYFTGGVVGLRAFSERSADLLLRDLNAQAGLLGLRSLQDFSLTLVISDRADDVRTYIEQIAPRTNAPLVAAVSYSAAPLVEPYVLTEFSGSWGALDGLLVGYQDGYTYGGMIDGVNAVSRAAEPPPLLLVGPTLVPEATATPTPSPTLTRTLPPTRTPSHTPTAEPTVIIAVVPLGQSINLRSAPNTSSAVVRALPPGSSLVVLGTNAAGDWTNVRADDGREGWVSTTLLSSPPTSTPSATHTSAPLTDTPTIRPTLTPRATRTPTDEPSPTPEAAAGEVPAPSETEEVTDEATLTPTQTPSRTTTRRPSATPIPASPTLSPTETPAATATSALPTGIINANQAVNIRSGPSTQFRALGSVRPGTQVILLGTDAGGGWTNIRTPDGVEGWVATLFITEDEPPQGEAKGVRAKPAWAQATEEATPEAAATDEPTTAPTRTPRPSATRTPRPSNTPAPETTAEATVEAAAESTAEATATLSAEATAESTVEAAFEMTAEATLEAAASAPPPPSPGYRDERWYALTLGIIASSLIISAGLLINVGRGIVRRNKS